MFTCRHYPLPGDFHKAHHWQDLPNTSDPLGLPSATEQHIPLARSDLPDLDNSIGKPLK
jgi:hypothetical protein